MPRDGTIFQDIRDANNFRILQLLSRKPLSWSELLEKCKLSRRTLSIRLKELETNKIVKKGVRRTRATGSSLMVYELNEKVQKEMDEVFRQTALFKRVERLASEFTKLFLAANKLDRLEKPDKSFIEYYNTIFQCAMAIFETMLSYNGPDSFKNAYISSEGMASMRQIIWKNRSVNQVSNEIRNMMTEDRDRNLREMEKKIASMAQRKDPC